MVVRHDDRQNKFLLLFLTGQNIRLEKRCLVCAQFSICERDCIFTETNLRFTVEDFVIFLRMRVWVIGQHKQRVKLLASQVTILVGHCLLSVQKGIFLQASEGMFLRLTAKALFAKYCHCFCRTFLDKLMMMDWKPPKNYHTLMETSGQMLWKTASKSLTKKRKKEKQLLLLLQLRLPVKRYRSHIWFW